MHDFFYFCSAYFSSTSLFEQTSQKQIGDLQVPMSTNHNYCSTKLDSFKSWPFFETILKSLAFFGTITIKEWSIETQINHFHSFLLSNWFKLWKKWRNTSRLTGQRFDHSLQCFSARVPPILKWVFIKKLKVIIWNV